MSYGHITKLSVNIAKCETYITYANNTTRLIINNPSGFVFRCSGPAAAECSEDAIPPASFLDRHFAKGGSLRRTRSMREFLLDKGLLGVHEHEQDCAEELEAELKVQAAAEQAKLEQLELEKLKAIEWYSWDLVQLPIVLPERATSHEWTKEEMQMHHCGWHLHTCHWSQCNGSASCLPDCYCIQIKETMDTLNELLNKSMPKPKPKRTFTFRPQAVKVDCAKMNDNIVKLTDRLQQLNNLLEQQNRNIFKSEVPKAIDKIED